MKDWCEHILNHGLGMIKTAGRDLGAVPFTWKYCPECAAPRPKVEDDGLEDVLNSYSATERKNNGWFEGMCADLRAWKDEAVKKELAKAYMKAQATSWK